MTDFHADFKVAQMHRGGTSLALTLAASVMPAACVTAVDVVDVELPVGESLVEITAAAETTAQTGVEMEALTAASVAALTVYDMAKAIDKELVIAEVRLLEKTKEQV